MGIRTDTLTPKLPNQASNMVGTSPEALGKTLGPFDALEFG